jgi:hypothetical protein
MSGEISGMAVSSIRTLARVRRRTTREGSITNLEPPGTGLIHVGANGCHVAARRLAFRTHGRLHPGAIKPARAEIELWVADLGYFRREQIREQNELNECLRSATRIRNLPLSCYFTMWAAGGSNPAPRIKRHVNPGLAGIDSCSFVLVSAAIELKGTDIRVAWCGPMLIGAAASGRRNGRRSRLSWSVVRGWLCSCL